MNAIIEVHDLTKRFGEQTAVDGISFHVDRGEVFGLLGPNGAGKTTTIRMLTTLIPPTSGEMCIAGFDVCQESLLIRHLLGYVPQSLSADAALSGYENLLIFAKLLGLPHQARQDRIVEVLELMHLDEAADRLVREYSGGMVRRLEIGQAILHRPHILVLDEPTVGLDPTARRSVWQALHHLGTEGDMTLLITTHYMEEADSYCDRVAIMDHGRIAAIGTPAALKGAHGGASLEEVFTTVTGSTLESGGSFREARQLRRRTRRFG